ncbi:FAD-dependent oxidoreductase [Thermomicrobium sp. CFH 73360]|uniref:FAD-dependent oxidoreductase n=1 Tax=Thermomicrobium sp. CFH 73360 TaxID=2951987 RepID=UPI00207681C8|nr:FAD-dependent oxidoreductase [Thermomicrobium sp. CFH 73360]MCM8745155.1 FAD-dependent oxidoreductase [Thermomicrobium sp. CFH 73360]
MSTHRERVVIIGGDAAGMSAASQLRRLRPEVEVIAFERGTYTSYALCGLPYLVAGLVAEPSQLVARTPEAHRRNGIDVRLHSEVIGIDLALQQVTVVDHEVRREYRESFDRLVIATGARPRSLLVPGRDAEGIFTIHSLDEALRLTRWLESQRPRSAVVVGGGYVGLEIAEAFITRGLQTTLLEAAPHVMALLDSDMAELVERELREAGVRLVLEAPVEGFETRQGRVTGVVTPVGTFEAEVVALGVGVEPNSELARDAGIVLGDRNAIHVDEHCRTSAPGVWAAGDCADAYHRLLGRSIYFPLGTTANKQGRVCGLDLAGREARFPGIVGTAITRFGETEIARTGLTEREAQSAGFQVVTAQVRSTTRSGYFPGATWMTVKIVAEESTGRLLGAQIVGGSGAGKRIDTVATALTAGLTLDEFIYLDLAYAPPFSPVWDPVVVAARKLAREV